MGHGKDRPTSRNGRTTQGNEREIDSSEIIRDPGESLSSGNARTDHLGSCAIHARATVSRYKFSLTRTNIRATDRNKSATGDNCCVTDANNGMTHGNVATTHSNDRISHPNTFDRQPNISKAITTFFTRTTSRATRPQAASSEATSRR